MRLNVKGWILSDPGPRQSRSARVRRPIPYLTCLALAMCLLSHCGNDCPTQGCTPSWEAGLWVRVLDAETGIAAACGAIAWASEGAYTDTLRTSGCDLPDSIQTGIMTGLYERPGIYDVHVEKAGYHSWHRADVKVIKKKCDCHVRRTTLEARLEPL